MPYRILLLTLLLLPWTAWAWTAWAGAASDTPVDGELLLTSGAERHAYPVRMLEAVKGHRPDSQTSANGAAAAFSFVLQGLDEIDPFMLAWLSHPEASAGVAVSFRMASTPPVPPPATAVLELADIEYASGGITYSHGAGRFTIAVFGAHLVVNGTKM